MFNTFRLKALLVVFALGCSAWALADDLPFSKERLNHWAYKPVQKPALHAVKQQAWVKTPVDAFILKKLEDNGLAPSSPADKITLLRRAAFDLTGLPPPPAEVTGFAGDELWPDEPDALVATGFNRHFPDEFHASQPAHRSRRNFLQQTGAGLSALALSAILGEDGFSADGTKATLDPLAAKKPHHKVRAKSVIWLFMEGGSSHLDTFDPKPELLKLAGKPMPESFGRPITAMGTVSNTIMPSQRVFKPCGQSGIPVSDWLPHIAQHVDDLAVLRSCWAGCWRGSIRTSLPIACSPPRPKR